MHYKKLLILQILNYQMKFAESKKKTLKVEETAQSSLKKIQKSRTVHNINDLFSLSRNLFVDAKKIPLYDLQFAIVLLEFKIWLHSFFFIITIRCSPYEWMYIF